MGKQAREAIVCWSAGRQMGKRVCRQAGRQAGRSGDRCPNVGRRLRARPCYSALHYWTLKPRAPVAVAGMIPRKIEGRAL